MKTLRVITGLLVVFQLPITHASFTNDLSHIQSTVMENSLESENKAKRWPTLEAPGWEADPGGLYRDRHRPDESDADLLEEVHDSSAQIVNMDHVYYTSKIVCPGDAGGADAWVDTERANKNEWKTHGFLSSTHRQAEEVTVATGGFIYTGDIIHRLLTATQYIAPLMADFDPSLSGNSSVFYFDNGSALVVQWSRLHLQDNIRSGTFTFQAALHSDGRVVFAYKEIPVDIRDISSENHPVKVGLSDAFMVLHEIEQFPNVRRRTIYEYHKVDILKSKISNATTIELLPLPTCLEFSSCAPCVTSQIGFNCSWCSRLQRSNGKAHTSHGLQNVDHSSPSASPHASTFLGILLYSRCSSGFDRNRQDWVDHGCQEERRDLRCLRGPEVTDKSSAHLASEPTAGTASAATSIPTADPLGRTAASENRLTGSGGRATSSPCFSTAQPSAGGKANDTGQQEQAGLLVGVVMVMVVMVMGILLSVYVYYHPTSTASLFFMERRLSRWPTMKFRRGSGHPSYAEVETPGMDRDGIAVIDPKQSFVMAIRRESEQKEGFIVPDPRERFLCSESF
ncbi:plexin domain-containing protein 2-like isoform X2 [Syngnathus typhle]|uniref:plexin domain-containing protein 2-like isoform X2 n=1 Tax=Syngnathus typhle TaxID=161592 RepID=UPI002A6AA454|nr:plexin domain-containing protein 2-like isoform X2 [Syngnathus typhle]